MATFRINVGIGKAGFICPSGFFLLLVANCQFVATSVTWTAPPPAWNQKDPTNIRTVDILVFNRSTQVHLKWNYTLSAGSNLQFTTFSIIDEVSSNDIGFKLRGSDTSTIFKNYRARFNISTIEVATLIINRATESEEATFQCKLTTLNNVWRYKVRVKLTERQIQLDQIPLNLSTVLEGNNITMQWRYSYTLGLSPSFRDATFTDLRDGEEKRIANKPGQGDLYVDPAYRDRFRIHIEDTKASMTILTARRSDSGRYKFKVETLNNDKLGGLTSRIEISVQFAANLTNVSRDQTVREDSSMQLLCEATGEPTPNITWIRVLQDGSNSEILHQGQTWDFPNISRTASGTYRCTADNGFENPVSHMVKVNVTYPAEIVKFVSKHEVAAQQSVSLHCQAEGNPEPAYSWTPCDPQQSVCHESTLNISEVLSDVVYTCNVTNSLGSDARNASVVIASTVINVTLVITSESCTDGQFSQEGLLWSKLQKTVDGIFMREISFQNSVLSDVRCGSVIVDLALKFNSTVKENDVLRTLQDAAKDGKLGDFDVNASSIVGTRPQTGTTASTRPISSPEIIVTPTAIPDQSDDDKALKDWMIAVIASVAGVLIIVILVLLIYCFTIRKKSDGADDVGMSPTLSYVVGGPSVSRSMDRRSYGMESVEDDPFILAASTHSLNSMGDSNKTKNPNVNYGYSSEDSVRRQPEMLLKPGSRVSSNKPTAQSTGEVVTNSSYLVRGPQRDLNTLPLPQEPPSFEEAMLRSETNGYLTEPGKGRYAGRRSKPSQATSGPSKEPLDPTVTYALPQKKKISSKPSAELHGSAPGNPPLYNQTERSVDSILQQQVDLALDDPSNLPPTENPLRNEAMFNVNKHDRHYDLPELPANFKSAVGRDSRSDSEGAILNPPASAGRKKLPYFNVHGQLVRPKLEDSGDVRRPESSRTTQNTLSPDSGIPLNEVQPRGSESENRHEQDNDYITFVV